MATDLRLPGRLFALRNVRSMKTVKVFHTLIMAASLWFCATLAHAAVLSAVQYDTSRAGHTVITNYFTDPVKAGVFFIPGDKYRVVADVRLTGIELDAGTFRAGQTHYDGQGHVEQLRIARQDDQTFRLVYDLREGAELTSHDADGRRLILNIRGERLDIQNPAGPVRSVERQVYTGGPRYFAGVPYPRLRPPGPRAAPRKYVIVIDPGHGGRDPGAIGMKGTYEKTITLKAAQELKELLATSGRYDVILTRSDDSYVEHEERTRIARARNADLFISLHADSAGRKSVRGASVYTLADRARKRSKDIIVTQNWIMDVDLSEHSDPVGDILVDLAQRKTRSQSDIFAKRLLQDISSVTTLVNNSHRRAGFFVLLAPDVPAVLLELGFLSNGTDEALLKSSTHRQKVLKQVKTAIDGYFAHQNP